MDGLFPEGPRLLPDSFCVISLAVRSFLGLAGRTCVIFFTPFDLLFSDLSPPEQVFPHKSLFFLFVPLHGASFRFAGDGSSLYGAGVFFVFPARPPFRDLFRACFLVLFLSWHQGVSPLSSPWVLFFFPPTRAFAPLERIGPLCGRSPYSLVFVESVPGGLNLFSPGRRIFFLFWA